MNNLKKNENPYGDQGYSCERNLQVLTSTCDFHIVTAATMPAAGTLRTVMRHHEFASTLPAEQQQRHHQAQACGWTPSAAQLLAIREDVGHAGGRF